MLNRLLSNDYPRSKVLAVILVAILIGLAFAPFLFPGVKALSVAAKVLIFVVLVASFDLLLGYTGIVSFAHTIFFAMITLAVAAAFQTLASQLSDITGGEDGLTFKVPEFLSPSFEPFEEPFLGVTIDGRLICYYLLFVTAVALVRALLRIVNSPFGRVLQAIRENEFRAEAIGYRVVVYRTTSSVLSALFATLAGCMLALWLRYNGPDTSLSFEIMMDCLLIVVIGGMGTIYGSAIGAVLFLVAQSYLQDLLRLGSGAATGLPWLSALLSPDRWLLWLGVLFVLSVYYFPTGVVGRLRAAAARKAG